MGRIRKLWDIAFKLALSLGLASALSAFAAPLEFMLDQTAVNAKPGDTVSFSGVITNRTGGTLASTDIFVDFTAYDASALVPTQTLGLIAFNIPNFTFTPSVSLFEISILPTASAGLSSFQVFLQDTSGNLTDPIAVDITIAAVPEPSTAAMMLAALIALGMLHVSRRHGDRLTRKPSPALL